MFIKVVLTFLATTVTVFIKATNVSMVPVTVIFAQITIMHLLLCFSGRARNDSVCAHFLKCLFSPVQIIIIIIIIIICYLQLGSHPVAAVCYTYYM